MQRVLKVCPHRSSVRMRRTMTSLRLLRVYPKQCLTRMHVNSLTMCVREWVSKKSVPLRTTSNLLPFLKQENSTYKGNCMGSVIQSLSKRLKKWVQSRCSGQITLSSNAQMALDYANGSILSNSLKDKTPTSKTEREPNPHD